MPSHTGQAEMSVHIPPSGITGDLIRPAEAQGIVVFAHGSGSSRFSSRNRFVAGVLQQGGFATLMLDLLTNPEEAVDTRTGHLRFDIAFLAERLLHATEWIREEATTRDLPIGYFGASTGAAAALLAASKSLAPIRAVVSRGGRPDLAEAALARVTAPTLLIVGGRDYPVLELNQGALSELTCPKQMEIIPEATHLFEEPGALEEVARLALQWFARYVSQDRVSALSRAETVG